MAFKEGEAVLIDYTNWRGERGERRIRPTRLFFGQTEWHPTQQWLLEAWDLDKQATRIFALCMIKQWQPAKLHECSDLQPPR